MNRPGSRNRKNKKKIRGALAGAGIVALVLALMISFGKTAPENPMDRNRADASRMYLLSYAGYGHGSAGEYRKCKY